MDSWFADYGGRRSRDASGVGEDEILEDFNELEPDDFRAIYAFAAGLAREKSAK